VRYARLNEFRRRRLISRKKKKNDIGAVNESALWLWVAISLPAKGKARIDREVRELINMSRLHITNSVRPGLGSELPTNQDLAIR
jgi:hypothetical protein